MGEYMSNNQMYSKRPMHGVAVRACLLQWRLIWSSAAVIHHFPPRRLKTQLSLCFSVSQETGCTVYTSAVKINEMSLQVHRMNSILDVFLLQSFCRPIATSCVTAGLLIWWFSMDEAFHLSSKGPSETKQVQTSSRTILHTCTLCVHFKLNTQNE